MLQTALRRALTVVFRLTALATMIAARGLAFADDSPSADWKWIGTGALRVFVRVDPAAEDSRLGDEGPAEVVLDFAELLAEVAPGSTPDLANVQVVRHQTRSGEPELVTPNAFGVSPLDLPCRWYDAAIPYEFPEVEANVSSTDGELRYSPRTRLGYFFDCLGDWKSGRLAFAHRASRRPAWYAVYFDLLAERESEPRDSPPRGFLGDGLQRCEPRGSSSTGLIHSRVARG